MQTMISSVLTSVSGFVLFNILPFVFLLGILVIIHEFGHYIVAKLSGIKVEKFSIGFPPKLISKKWGETEYIISLLPLGGYVKLAGENEWDKDPSTAKDYEFSSKSPLTRIAVVFAGPFMNVVLAVLFFFMVNMIGMNVLYNPSAPGKVGIISDNSPAYEAGLIEGDEIYEIDGKRVRSWNDLLELSFLPTEETYQLTVIRNNEKIEKSITPRQVGERRIMGISQYISTEIGSISTDSYEYEAGLRENFKIISIDGYKKTQWNDVEEYLILNSGNEVMMEILTNDNVTKNIQVKIQDKSVSGGQLGIVPEQELINGKILYTNVIKEVKSDYPAAESGLKSGDEILSINGYDVKDYFNIFMTVLHHRDNTVNITLVRDDNIIEKEVFIPESEVALGYLNILPKQYSKKYGFFTSISNAFKDSVKYIYQTYDVFRRLITRQLDAQKVMGGPISIFKFSGLAARSGIAQLFLLVAVISINLAVINLFPIPVLDGGMILFFLYELITKRKVPEKIVEKSQQIGWALIITLAVFVFYIDIAREIF